MTPKKFLDSMRCYRPVLSTVIDTAKAAIEGGERNFEAISTAARLVAVDPIAIEFCTDPNGLRDFITGKLSDIAREEKQDREQAERAERERRKAETKKAEVKAVPAQAVRPIKTVKEAEPEEPESADPDLLPFASFPGYALDVWGRPHGVSGQGRKRGPLTPDKHWKPRKKGQKPCFVWRYRLYRYGERVDRSAKFCMIARHNAERALWDHGKGEAEELRSMGVHD